MDDVQDFLCGANILLKSSGNLILEVPDLNSLIEKIGFDTIYHEHRHYFSENSINKILNKNGFYINNIEKIKYMSGSLRVFASKNKKNKIKLRKITLNQFKKFKENTIYTIERIKNFVLKNSPVIGIGAATKGNTLLNCCSFTDKDVKFILDKSKFKINKFTPGSGIKIKKETKLIGNYSAIILPWNITKYLLKKKYFKKLSIHQLQKLLRTSNDKKTNKSKR